MKKLTVQQFNKQKWFIEYGGEMYGFRVKGWAATKRAAIAGLKMLRKENDTLCRHSWRVVRVHKLVVAK